MRILKWMPVLLCVLGCLCALDTPLRAAPRPNILFLLSDDHSYPFLGCYGSLNVHTPNLDRFAAEGIKFHRFFTGAPQCVPSRATLMTGRSPVAARMTRFSSPLPRDEVIFPELLREKAGYFTGVCGRTFHLDGATRGGDALVRVFEQHKLASFKDRMDYVDVSKGEGVAARVIEFLDKKPAGKPFFLWVNFNAPHHPWNEVTDPPAPETLKVPGYLPDLPGVRKELSAYCGEVNRLDLQVKTVLDVLQQRGLAATTLVVFCGDNGLAFPHGKGSLYDPGLNVPCLVRWPEAVKPGGESRELLSGEDLGPTLLDVAGIPAPARMSGKSFLRVLRGEAHTPRSYIFAERGSHGSSAPVKVDIKNSSFDLSRCVRSERFKFIYNCTPWIPYSPVDSAGGPGWQDIMAADGAAKLTPAFHTTYFTTPRTVYELYDLEADPSELNNLSGKPEHAAVEQQLREALTEKMILDFDYLPLPDLGGAASKGGGKKKNR
jgi:N-sulfoglucosamine sulfohydrolase